MVQSINSSHNSSDSSPTHDSYKIKQVDMTKMSQPLTSPGSNIDDIDDDFQLLQEATDLMYLSIASNKTDDLITRWEYVITQVTIQLLSFVSKNLILFPVCIRLYY